MHDRLADVVALILLRSQQLGEERVVELALAVLERAERSEIGGRKMTDRAIERALADTMRTCARRAPELAVAIVVDQRALPGRRGVVARFVDRLQQLCTYLRDSRDDRR